MKKYYFRLFISVIVVCLFSSFGSSGACEYVSSNMGYVKDQTQKAITKEDINQARFYAYKALKAIEKSKKDLANCGCKPASRTIAFSLNDLITATRTTTLDSTRMLLKSALKNTVNSLESLDAHDAHEGEYDDDVLVMNTVPEEGQIMYHPRDAQSIHTQIDQSLLKYQASLDHVVETVDCKKAQTFAQRIYDHCEQQLLNEDLSEEKKYYNLRTKEITQNALNQLKNCIGHL